MPVLAPHTPGLSLRGGAEIGPCRELLFQNCFYAGLKFNCGHFLDVLGLFLIFWEYSRGEPFWFAEFFLEDFSIFFSRGRGLPQCKKKKKYSSGEKDPRREFSLDIW